MAVIKTLLITGLLLMLTCHAHASPEFPPPPKSSIGLLGEDLVVYGIPMDIRQFATSRSLQEVVDFYRQLWAGNQDEDLPGHFISRELPPWTIITRIEGNYLLTVQAASDGKRGSSGYLAVSPLIPRKQSSPGKDFPKMRGSTVLAETYSNDSGKKGRTLVLQNASSVQSNANFYRHYYKQHGWQTEMDDGPYKGPSHTLRFRNLNKHVTLVINNNDDSTVVTSVSVTEGLM